MRAFLGLLTGADFLIGLGMGILGFAVTLLLRGRQLDWGTIWLACVVASVGMRGRFDWRRFQLADVPFVIWLAALVVTTALAMVLLSRRHQASIPASLPLVHLGIWAGVPDTEQISIIFGVTVAAVWAWSPLRLARPARLGAAAVAASTVWSVLLGAGRRSTAAVTGLGSIAILALISWAPTSKTISPSFAVFGVLLLNVIWIGLSRLGNETSLFIGFCLLLALVASGAWRAWHDRSDAVDEVENGGGNPLPFLGSKG